MCVPTSDDMFVSCCSMRVCAGLTLTLSHVRLHGLLLYPPGSPSMSSGMALPLLSHYYDATWGSLHVEHSVIITLCSTLRQWVQAYGKGSAAGVASVQLMVSIWAIGHGVSTYTNMV